MSTRALVDSSLLASLELLSPPDFSTETLPAIREMVDDGIAAQGLPDFDGRIWEQSITGPDGHALRLLIFTPRERQLPGPAVLTIHGGGYVIGNANMGCIGNGHIAAMTGAVVVAVDYRLAPDTPFPGPLDDCYAALEWVHANAATLGIDPGKVAIKGDSAGAGLAAALALLARDRGGPPIRHQTLIYPMIDDRTGSVGDPHPYTGEFVWTAANNRFGWAALLGGTPGGDDVPAYAAAARAENLRDLPPAFISTGALDLFVEEDIEYARRLIRAGVPTELHLYPGAYHGFDFNTESPLTQAMLGAAIQALQRAFA